MNWKNALVVCVAAGLAFSYGVLMSYFDLFPKQQLRAVLHWVKPPRERAAVEARTGTFTDIEFETFAISDLVGLGSIDAFEDKVIGTDRLGNFFLYSREPDKAPDVSKLNVAIDTAYDKFVEHGEKAELNLQLDWFRVHDVLFDPDTNRLFASHHYWHADRDCSTVRFSMVTLESDDLASVEITTTDWRILYETSPCVPLQLLATPFEGLLAGGRMALRSEKELLVTVGDHGLNGMRGSEDHPQDPKSSYGKVLSLDLENGMHKALSIGHRNPQGLLIDSANRIWITEHGPRGGDELNLIEENANYGWPIVTYGVQYDYKSWPRTIAEEQGRHRGFQPAVYVWLPSVGVSQIIQSGGFVTAWEGDYLVASMKAGTLFRIRYEDDRLLFVSPTSFGKRLRDLDQLDDGTIVLWTDNSEIVEVRPVVLEPVFTETADVTSPLQRQVLDTMRVCRECHGVSPGTDSEQSPNLWGVVGRKLADTEYPFYSESLRSRGGSWDRATLDAFLRDPRAFAPGTTMAYGGIANDDLREAFITYLESMQGPGE